jgi:outer membrane protein OmpA-like peptidoglycan-associated protein
MKGKIISVLPVLLFAFSELLGSIHTDAGVILHGRVLDARTLQPVTGRVRIYLDSDIFMKREDLEYGEFTEQLREYGWYLIKISAKGYHEATDTLWVLNDSRPGISRDYLMNPQTFSTAFSNNIYFDRNKASLTAESLEELDGMVRFLNENPDMSCEIEGHADRTGPADYNLALSEDRAYVVFDFLLSKGIDRARLRTFGYGSALPKDDDMSTESRPKNRRVEIIPFMSSSEAIFPTFANVYFDFGTTTFPKESTSELESIIQFLNANPRATCEIAGHADNVGTVAVNMAISQQRAESVIKYLIAKGLDRSRLKARGYGSSRPMEENATSASRAKNRRVEFNIRVL